MATFTGADRALGFLFDIARNIADDYDNTRTYVQGAYTIYAGTLYKCTTLIQTPEDFNIAHWQSVLIMDEIAAGGGGGGGTTVIANPAGAATDTLNKLQVATTIYDIPSGGGGSGHNYSTNEQIVGTWLHGETIYEKTFDLGSNIEISYNSWTTLNGAQLNELGGIVSAEGATETLGTYTPFIATYTTQNQNIYIQLQTPRNSVRSTVRFLTLRYTKSAT